MPDAVVTRLCRRLAVKSVCTKYKVRSIFPQVWPSIRKEVRPVPAQCPSLVSGSLGRRNKKEKKVMNQWTPVLVTTLKHGQLSTLLEYGPCLSLHVELF